MSVKTIDQQLHILESKRDELLEFQVANLSESDTRSKIIDSIFKEVLGWDERNITREEVVKDPLDETLYIDYVLESGKSKFLIEAKKSGIYFNLPTQTRKCKRKGVLSKDAATNRALEQAYQYCLLKHISFGCISNGCQIIVFALNSGNLKFDCFIFRDIDDIIKNFIDFYNIFSPYSEGQTILNTLLNKSDVLRQAPQFNKKVNDVVYNSEDRINRNPLDIYIRPIISEFLSDITSDPQLLEECYCVSNDRIPQYEKQLTSLLKDDSPRIGVPVQAASFFDKDFRTREKEFRKPYSKSDFMVIVGGVGSGKTTFIHHYFRRILPEEIRRNVVWFYIDFREQSKDSIDIKEYIVTECLNQLRDKYDFIDVDSWDTLQKIYLPEITRLKNGPLKPVYEQDKNAFDIKISDILMEKLSNKSQYGEDVLRYVATKSDFRKMVCITIDNADQLDEEFQKKCFITAYDFSKRINSLILLSLREDSFWRLRNIKPFDAYYSYAYHISAPSISTIIARRLEVATKYLGKNVMEINENGAKFQIKIADFLRILYDSLYHKNKTINISLFEALSSGNLRLATNMIGTFLNSGHTNTREYIQTYFLSGEYIIPYHAFLRSIALGDYTYYHSDKSLLSNIFSIDNDGFFSHFSKLKVLNYLNERVNLETQVGRGFVKITSMYLIFNQLYDSESSFRNVLTTLLSRRIIEADNGSNVNGNDSDFIRITSAGYYYLNTLIEQFAYLERVCEDTPILSREDFIRLEDLTNEISMADPLNNGIVLGLRLKRVSLLLEYLQKQERNDNKYMQSSELEILFMPRVIQGFSKQRQKIMDKMKGTK